MIKLTVTYKIKIDVTSRKCRIKNEKGIGLSLFFTPLVLVLTTPTLHLSNLLCLFVDCYVVGKT